MSQLSNVRPARVEDIPALAAIIRGVGLFTAEEADGFVASLPAALAESQDGQQWLITSDGSGAALFQPEPAPGVWNMLFLGVLPESRRCGVGRDLVTAVEHRAIELGARMLLIDTSSLPAMAPARALYASLGYEQVAEIPDYWAVGDSKLTFRRVLS